MQAGARSCRPGKKGNKSSQVADGCTLATVLLKLLLPDCDRTPHTLFSDHFKHCKHPCDVGGIIPILLIGKLNNRGKVTYQRLPHNPVTGVL